MKQFYFIILLAFTIAPMAHSQEFAPLHSQWHFQYWSINSDEIVTFYSAQVNRDTIINNRYVTVLSLMQDNIIVPEADILVNEQNNRIYFFENDSFKLFFDFNLVAGDTLTFSVPENYQFYDISCGNVPDESETHLAKVKIDSITQNYFGGQLLNVFHTSPVEFNISQYFNWDLGNVYERIGSKNGIFGYSTSQCLGGDPGHFRCYSDSLIQFQSTTQECDYLLSTSDAFTLERELKIFPNPANHNLSFNLSSKSDVVIEIYDQIGKLRSSNTIKPLNRGSIITIDFNLENGIYIAIIKTDFLHEVRRFQVLN
jgi:hypothetical protein